MCVYLSVVFLCARLCKCVCPLPPPPTPPLPQDTLLHALSQGIAVPFQYDAYPEGHRLTNFTAWRHAASDYTVQHEYR